MASQSKKPKLTVKETKLVQGVAAGKSQTQAAIEAGYGSTPESAKAIASKTLSKVNVQQALQVALEKHGITLDKALAPIGEALTADKVVIIGKGDDAFADVTPDHSVRLQASDRALKLMGVSGQEAGTVNVNFINVQKQDKDEFGL